MSNGGRRAKARRQKETRNTSGVGIRERLAQNSWRSSCSLPSQVEEQESVNAKDKTESEFGQRDEGRENRKPPPPGSPREQRTRRHKTDNRAHYKPRGDDPVQRPETPSANSLHLISHAALEEFRHTHNPSAAQ